MLTHGTSLSYSNLKSRKYFPRVSLLQEDRVAVRHAGFSTLESQPTGYTVQLVDTVDTAARERERLTIQSYCSRAYLQVGGASRTLAPVQDPRIIVVYF
jgi:hypothetical protein